MHCFCWDVQIEIWWDVKQQETKSLMSGVGFAADVSEYHPGNLFKNLIKHAPQLFICVAQSK